MTKLLVINYEYPPLGGGGGVAAKKLCEGFIKHGYEIDYLTTQYGDALEEEIIEGVHIYRVKVWGKRTLKNADMFSLLSFPICAYRKAYELCKKNKYDGIQTHFAVPSGPLGYKLSKKFSLKNTLFIYGGDIYDPTKRFSPHKWWILRKYIAKLFKEAYAVIAESTDICLKAEQYYKVKKKIQIMPLIYDNISFERVDRNKINMKEDMTYIISIGRLVRRKGFEFLLDIMSELDESVALNIIGDGPERNNLLSKIKQLGIEDRVNLLGNLSEENKFQYLSNSDIYVLSSIHEGFGIVLQEAMQVGLPIVATDNGGQVDIISEGQNGFLIKYSDVDQAVKCINELISNTILHKKIANMNIEKIKDFSEEVIINKCINIMGVRK